MGWGWFFLILFNGERARALSKTQVNPQLSKAVLQKRAVTTKGRKEARLDWKQKEARGTSHFQIYFEEHRIYGARETTQSNL